MNKLILAIFLTIFASSSFAITMTNLYQAQIPVAAQTDDLKEQAIKAGLLQVLIKLSGDAAIGDNPLIKPNLYKADYYVQEFNYSAGDAQASQYLLTIHYEKNDVNRLLHKSGIAFWGDVRPLILVWLAVANQHQAIRIISNENPGTVFNAMQFESRRYGLPLIFPVMDVADVSQISSTDITSHAIPALKEAGKRYAPDGLLVGTLTQTAKGYDSDWQLLIGNDKWDWHLSDTKRTALIAILMKQMSQVLAQHYVVKEISIPLQWLKIEVMNITQRTDLVQLMQYLKSLSLVKQIKLSQVSSDVVDLAVLVRGSSNAFIENTNAEKRLTLKFQDRADNRLVFVWVH